LIAIIDVFSLLHIFISHYAITITDRHCRFASAIDIFDAISPGFDAISMPLIIFLSLPLLRRLLPPLFHYYCRFMLPLPADAFSALCHFSITLSPDATLAD